MESKIWKDEGLILSNKSSQKLEDNVLQRDREGTAEVVGGKPQEGEVMVGMGRG